MKRPVACICGVVLAGHLIAPPPSVQSQQRAPEDVLRITTQLVQTDVVVTDKNDQIISDLKPSDFEVFENGKLQDLQFVEFVNTDGPRSFNNNPTKPLPNDVASSGELIRRNVRRVMAFVVDDVTIPAEDMARVRLMLTAFLDQKMQDGDLVAIVRTVGGRGLLEQFTSDRQILRRAIMQLGVRSLPPYLVTTGEEERVTPPSPLADKTATQTVSSNNELEGPSESTNQIPRAMLVLSVSRYIIDGLRQVPGRKNLILLSGGLPLFDLTRGGSFISDVSFLFRAVTDDATRSGVVINTMDVRGLSTAGAIAKFQDTPGRSALGGGTFAGNDTNSIGRGFDPKLLGERSLTEELTLRDLSGRTGGIAVVNTNNFGLGLDKILSRNHGYYRLAYRPSEPFDNKFHRVTIKVKGSGTHTYTADGYYAREEKSTAPVTKEQEIIKAAMSPLATRDLELAAELQYRFLPNNQAHLDINTFIDARKLQFSKSADGKYRAAFDIAGFLFDQSGRKRGGISDTVDVILTEEAYQRALTAGLSYSANTDVPAGYYQVRLAVREVGTGRVGTVSRYFEVPDLSRKQLMMSSIMLYQIDPGTGNKSAEQLSPTRMISRKLDLRYAVIVYNPKLEADKPLARSQLMISFAGKVLFKEPEQSVQTRGTAAGQFIRVGQVGLSKVNPGRYLLTVTVTDPLADKKRQTISRSVDFTVVD